MCLTITEERERITSHDVLALLFLMQPRRPMAAFATTGHCWLMSNSVSTLTARSFFAKLISNCSVPLNDATHIWCINTPTPPLFSHLKTSWGCSLPEIFSVLFCCSCSLINQLRKKELNLISSNNSMIVSVLQLFAPLMNWKCALQPSEVFELFMLHYVHGR